MNKYDKIFMETDPLTNEELQQYLSGNLSATEKHRVELKISSDPFLSDAIDGYAESGLDLKAFDEISNKFQSSATSGSASGSGMWIAGIAVVVISVAGISLSNEISNAEKSAHPQVVYAELQQDEPVEVTDEEISAEIEKELEEVEPIQQQEVITYSKTKQNQPLTVATNTEEDLKTEEPVYTSVDLETVEIPKPEEINLTTTVLSNTKIRYAHDLKTVDLDRRYDWRIRVRNNTSVNSGLRAYRADYSYDRNRHQQPVVKPYTYVHYNEFLDSALYLYSTNNFRSALKAFNVMISQFPDDVNAHFYGALCYYNLGKAEKAITYLDEVLKSDINSFDQEAEFYKALSLKKAGYPEYAKDLFGKIVREGKFYAKQAQEELDKF